MSEIDYGRSQKDITPPSPVSDRPDVPQHTNEPTKALTIQGEKAITILTKRRSDSERMMREGKTLQEMVEYFDNDYSALDEVYRETVGVGIVSDPYEAAQHEIPIDKSCSIVIPAYNSGPQLENALLAIQASSFNAKYPQLLEVIIIDDGSPKVKVADVVKKLNLDDLNIKVYRESNGRENKARYSGVLQAKGDIVIFTAQDTVYSPTMIEEYMKRHQVLDGIICFGFRDNIDIKDPRLTPKQIAAGSIGEMGYDFGNDGRIAKDGLADCNWLKESGHYKPLPIDAESEWYGWTTPSIAWGFSVSAPREALLRTRASHDERYKGFGGDDEHMIADLIADGNYVIPLTSGLAHHERHNSRWDENEAAVNQNIWAEYKNSTPKRQDVNNPVKTDAELQLEIHNNRTSPKEAVSMPQPNTYDHAKTLLQLGLYEQAVNIFKNAQPDNKDDPWFHHNMAVALMKTGKNENISSAFQHLAFAMSKMPKNTWVRTTLGQVSGMAEDYDRMIAYYQDALRLDPTNPDANIIIPPDGVDLEMHVNELYTMAQTYFEREKPQQALQFANAAIGLMGEDKAATLLALRDAAMNKLSERLENKNWEK